MNLVGPTAISYHKKLTFNFSNTLRNQKVNLEKYAQGGYVIDINGDIYSSGNASEDSATVTIIGGSDKFVNEKANRLESTYFMTEPQKAILYKIMMYLSKKTDSAEITSNNGKLEQSLNALYSNNCG